MADATPVASLPMYDWPEVAWATDALWSAVAERLAANGIAAPPKLDRLRAFDAAWHDPGLVLSQTCGYPFSTRLRGIVRLVGTPIHAVPGCRGPYYSSMIVVRANDPAKDVAGFAGSRVAYNSSDSLSGYLLLRLVLAEAGLKTEALQWIETGSHRLSIRSVAEGRADIAAIDAVCWALALEHEPDAAAELKVIAQSRLYPAPPFITAGERAEAEVEVIRAALRDAIADPANRAACSALRLAGLGEFDEWDYGPLAALGRSGPADSSAQ